MFSRDNRGDDLFTNSTIDSSNPDKIIIREKDSSKRKVRRRVKKGTKEQVLSRREELRQASKIKIVDEKKKMSIFDTTSFDFVDLGNAGENFKRRPENPADDKGYKIPRLSEINRKDSFDDNFKDDFKSASESGDGSDFRKSSADWRDVGTPDWNDYKPDYTGLEELTHKKSGVSAFQIVAAIVAIALFVTSVLTTNVYAKKQCLENKEAAFAKLVSYEDNTSEMIAEAVEDVEAPISMEAATPQISKILSLVLSSVEKDLKIKLIDEDDTLVKDIPWSVTVSDEDGNSSEEFDDDQDGIIHLTDVSAGDYSVTLNPSDALSDYEFPTSAQLVSVKAKVEYKVIANIKDEIKSEKEINAAAEDAAGNQAADVETAPPASMDTVEFVESTMLSDGEEYVEAIPDLKMTAKNKGGNKFAELVEKIRSTAASKFGASSLGYVAILADENDPAPQSDTGDGGGTENNSEQSHSSHDFSGSVTSNNDGTHKIKCTGCDETQSENCNTSGDGGSCSKCGYKKAHEHDFSGSITSNNDGTHKIKCAGCDETKTENCDTSGDGGKCSKCGYKKAHEHDFSGSITSNNDGTHKIKCNGCDESKSENCDTSGSDGKCSKCGYKKPAEEHRLTYTSLSNVKHKVTCSVSNCGDGHNRTEESCTYKDGFCEKCGATDPRPEETSITLSGNTSVNVNETTTITATITPSDKTISEVYFAESDYASASIEGKNIIVRGVKPGSTRMYVKSDNGKEAKVTIHVNAANGVYADDAQLYDALKNALYRKDGDSYVLAKYKDYREDPNQKFYKKQEVFIYTGWQTIDGQKCYFDKDHNRVKGRQIIGGVEYDFGDDGEVSTGSGSLGIDVSKYQPSINWNSVKASGVDYVIIRCGYRGSSTGVLVEDPYFKSHIKGAKAAGLKVGVYFFTTALTESEAVEEASMCAYLCNGYSLDFPIFMDCENSPRPGYNGMGAGQRTAIIKAFCNTIKSAGYSAGVYANKTWLSSYMNAGELSGYKIWLAQYNQSGPTYSGRYDMWQYTSKGSVNGISGYVDMNKCYYK